MRNWSEQHIKDLIKRYGKGGGGNLRYFLASQAKAYGDYLIGTGPSAGKQILRAIVRYEGDLIANPQKSSRGMYVNYASYDIVDDKSKRLLTMNVKGTAIITATNGETFPFGYGFEWDPWVNQFVNNGSIGLFPYWANLYGKKSTKTGKVVTEASSFIINSVQVQATSPEDVIPIPPPFNVTYSGYGLWFSFDQTRSIRYNENT